MKYKNYLVRINKEKFILARGTTLSDDSTLALVQGWSEPLPDFKFWIIDIATGLFVVRGKTKPKTLAKFEEYKPEFYSKIKGARTSVTYKDRCQALEEEVGVWKESGYIL